MSLAIAVVAWVIGCIRPGIRAVDPIWPVFILATTLTYVLLAPALAERAYLMLFLVTLWAVRLTIFLILGNWGASEARAEQRPQSRQSRTFRLETLYTGFGQQAILAWIVSLPLLVVTLGGTPLGPVDFVAVGLWLIGFGIQAIGDQQSVAFRASAANHGKALARGLWRYSRNPSQFGEICIWWANYLLALAAGGWWTLLSPLLVTFLLLRISGSSQQGRDLGEHCHAQRE